jgi:hypothetical protein
MLGSTLYINPQTALILCIGLSLLINQSYKYTIFIAQCFSQVNCKVGNLAILIPKSYMQMCRMCRVGVGFLAFFGLFRKK